MLNKGWLPPPPPPFTPMDDYFALAGQLYRSAISMRQMPRGAGSSPTMVGIKISRSQLSSRRFDELIDVVDMLSLFQLQPPDKIF